MNKTFILTCAFAVLMMAGCKKEEFGLLSQNHPDVPVTVTNLYGMYNGVPTVATSLSGSGAVAINMSIPASSGRTIKEITRVGISNVPNNYKVVQTSSGLYNTAPITASGTSVAFSTTLAEYTAKTGLPVTASGTATSFLGRYFYFLITLDNGETLIPVPVRVYVNN
jgi:hypothetical protein